MLPGTSTQDVTRTDAIEAAVLSEIRACRDFLNIDRHLASLTLVLNLSTDGQVRSIVLRPEWRTERPVTEVLDNARREAIASP